MTTKKPLKQPLNWLKHYWRRGTWQKIVTVGVTSILIVMAIMYGIARWYAWSERHVPLTMGVSFVPDYATYLGVDPEATMDSLIKDVGIRNFRLTSYWSDIEPTPGQYDFSQLDWEFQKAEASHSKITLAIGLRQPRYPECHPPEWSKTEPAAVWQKQLKAEMVAVINRYKDSPSLQSYQLENEYFLKGFGDCTDFSRQRLVDEFNLVKQTDPQHTLIISRSNNAIGFPLGKPTPDEFGISVYRRVWDQTLRTHRYLEYPFPSWFYGFIAGTEKILTGKDTIIHELQAEAWAPGNSSIPTISLAEQNKSFNSKRFVDTVNFGKATSMKSMYLWGGEYWYYRQQVLHDPSLMRTAQDIFDNYNLSNTDFLCSGSDRCGTEANPGL